MTRALTLTITKLQRGLSNSLAIRKTTLRYVNPGSVFQFGEGGEEGSCGSVLFKCTKRLATLLQDVPQNSATQHGLILLGRGKRLLYMGREFAPSVTEVFRNHRKFTAIFTMKKGRMRMVGSNSVPLDYWIYSCSLPLVHGYHVLKGQ
jgi:hypothetical protein